VRKLLLAHYECVEGAHFEDPPLDRPALTFVRNPWDWYVSWFLYTMEHQRSEDPLSTYALLCDYGQADFKSAVSRAVFGDDSSTWVGRLGRYGGLYTRWWAHSTNRAREAGVLDVRRFERLRKDLLAFLEPSPNAVAEAIREAPLENVSEREPYQRYYDDETREIVARCPLVAEFGYEF
jgi:hypothetical protein